VQPAQDEVPAAQRLTGLLVLAAVVGTINGLSRVAMPLFAASVGAPAWQVGLVGGLGYAGMLTLALPMGAWVDRHGSRTMFTRGVLVASLLYGVLSLARQPWQAVLGAGLLGLVLPFRVIPAHTEFLALLPQLAAAKAGWNRAANTVGLFFLGPALSAAVISALGFGAVFGLAAGALLLAWLVGRRVLHGPAHGSGLPPDDLPLAQRVRAQLQLLAGHDDLRRTMAIDFFTQMAVAYFVVFALILATRRFGLSLQAAASLVTLQGATYVLLLFVGSGWVMRWREGTRYLVAFALLSAQGLLCGLGQGPWALWLGAALMGLGMGLQGLTSTTRFAALMQRYGRGRIGGMTSLGPPAGGVLGALLGRFRDPGCGLRPAGAAAVAAPQPGLSKRATLRAPCKDAHDAFQATSSPGPGPAAHRGSRCGRRGSQHPVHRQQLHLCRRLGPALLARRHGDRPQPRRHRRRARAVQELCPAGRPGPRGLPGNPRWQRAGLPPGEQAGRDRPARLGQGGDARFLDAGCQAPG
jgi:MFS family permease